MVIRLSLLSLLGVDSDESLEKSIPILAEELVQFRKRVNENLTGKVYESRHWTKPVYSLVFLWLIPTIAGPIKGQRMHPFDNSAMRF